jgi:hypothetical protein
VTTPRGGATGGLLQPGWEFMLLELLVLDPLVELVAVLLEPLLESEAQWEWW